jgi:iron complex transport system permease protein
MTAGYFMVNISLYSIFCLAAVLVAPLFGAEKLDWRAVFQGSGGIAAEILFGQRIPRVFLALFAGGGLALAGAVFQSVFRNPLAEPFTLGVTGGAAVGAVAAISFPGILLAYGPFSTVQVFSLAGSLGTLLFLYLLSRSREGMSVNTILLAGVSVNIIASGAIMLMRYIVSPGLLVEMDRWLMGGLDITGYHGLYSLLPLALPGLWLLFELARELDHLSLGKDMAEGYGVDVERVHRKAFLGGGLLTAGIVSLAGPIGFVGLVIPHIVRKLSGHSNLVVLPASFLLGGGVLVLCDTIARTVLSPTEIPVGVITALAGAPVFIYILVRKQPFISSK